MTAMRLRNKKTGEIGEAYWATFREYGTDLCISMHKNGAFEEVHSLAELNEEWEDYKPTGEKPKRYRLMKDLPTFKAGEVFEIGEDGSLFRIDHTGNGSGRVMAYHRKTLDKFPSILEEWFEEIKPVEPLIKDEKIRKAVRAWAEASGLEHFTVINEHFNCCKIMGRKCNRVSKIEFLTTIPNATHQTYTIAELCGEEQE